MKFSFDISILQSLKGVWNFNRPHSSQKNLNQLINQLIKPVSKIQFGVSF